jgi:hypothetical protein
MKNTAPTVIRLSITSDVRRALGMAKKRYPTLSDPEILKLGLSKIVTEYDEPLTLSGDRNEVRLGASAALGEEYLSDAEEDAYTVSMGNKVTFS